MGDDNVDAMAASNATAEWQNDVACSKYLWRHFLYGLAHRIAPVIVIATQVFFIDANTSANTKWKRIEISMAYSCENARRSAKMRFENLNKICLTLIDFKYTLNRGGIGAIGWLGLLLWM